MNRILVIRGGAIGDFILTLPALKALRSAQPKAHIEILGYKHIAVLAENRFYAQAVHSIEYGLLARFFARNSELPAELADYFAGARTTFDVPIVYPGTAFQQAVWEQLLRIPYGETRSYEDIAVAVGRPSAQRAVGMANGKNRIAIVIPCHRVVNKGGRLGGYGGGLWRKQFLLDLERGH